MRSATPASVWTPAEQKPSLGAAQGSLKSQREPAQQRPLRLEAPSRSAPSKGGTSCQRVQCKGSSPWRPHREPRGPGLDLSSATRGKGQDGMRAGGGLEGSGSRRVTPSRDEGAQARDLGSPDRYRAASNCRSIQAGALGGRFHSRAAGGTREGGVSFRISTVPVPT